MNSFIVVCFLEKVWSTGLKKQIAIHKIELCFTIMRELSERYWAASFFLSYFEAAFERAESSSAMNRHADSRRMLAGGSDSGPPQELMPMVPGQVSSMSGSLVSGFGNSVVFPPIHSDAVQSDHPPDNFWSAFMEDFQQSDNFNFDFVSNLE